MIATKEKRPVLNFGQCRCCRTMKNCQLLNEKYEDMGEVYFDMIKNCFGVELSHVDGKSSERLICTLCLDKLHQASEFKAQVLQSEQAFIQGRLKTRSGSNRFTYGEKRVSLSNSVNLVREMRGQNNVSAGNGDNVIRDGFDDEISADLLQEYYSLQSFNMAIIAIEKNTLKNLLACETERNPETNNQIDYRLVRSGYSSADDDLPLQSMNTLKHRETGSKPNTSNMVTKNTKSSYSNANLAQTYQPLRQANISLLLNHSYVCPFKTRYNHTLCYYCGQYYWSPGSLREHSLTHDPKEFKPPRYRYTKLDITRIDCRLCEEKICDLEDFKRHLVLKHKLNYNLDVKDSVLPFKLVENENKCALCGAEFSYFYGLHKHMNQHFSNYMCENCGMGFMHETGLQNHMPAHDGKRYPCDTCGNTFKSDYARLKHIQRIHKKDEAVLFCSKCEAQLSPREKASHMSEVHGEPTTLTCTTCNQVFRSRRMLTLHVRQAHMKDYRHQCLVCLKRFFSRSALSFHMPTHTGERGFRCKVCHKSYPRSKTLKEHMKIHNNDRRFRCHICGQAFVQNCSLKGHMKSKHPEQN